MANQIELDVERVVDATGRALATYAIGDVNNMVRAAYALARHTRNRVSANDVMDFAIDLVRDANQPAHVVKYAIVHKFGLVANVH